MTSSRVLSVILAGYTFAANARAQFSQKDQEILDHLKKENSELNLQNNVRSIVTLTGNLGGAEVLGAGIVVGWQSDTLYIITANHLIRRGQAVASALRVKFEGTRADGSSIERSANVLAMYDSKLDLALIAIHNITRSVYNFCRWSTYPAGSSYGLAVLPVGNPNGYGRIVPANRDAVVKVDYPRIFFQSQTISRGHSGGALLTTNGWLVGMIVEDSPPFGVALSVYEILQKLHEWYIPEQVSGGNCDEIQDYSTIKEAQPAAEAGDVAAMDRIGWAYASGVGVPKDSELGVTWLQKSAEAGSSAAMNHLGMFYSKDYQFERSKAWYEKAVAAGSTAALYNLGLLYERGSQADFARAREWYEKAASKGRASAMYRIGLLYENGKGTTKDLTIARQWYEKAAAAGDAEAAAKLKTLQ
jgi:hypothetical protein